MAGKEYSHFDTLTGGRVAGGAKRDIKANSAELKLKLRLSLAIPNSAHADGGPRSRVCTC